MHSICRTSNLAEVVSNGVDSGAYAGGQSNAVTNDCKQSDAVRNYFKRITDYIHAAKLRHDGGDDT